MQAHFSAQTLAEVFRDLYVRERVGALSLTREDVEKRIYFERGLIVYADSDLDEEDLGYCLVDEGKISSGALEEARSNIDSPVELAQVLIKRDLVAKDALDESVRELVSRVVRSTFRWEGGTARFDDGVAVPGRLESDMLTTFGVILQGINEMAGFAPIAEALRGLDNRLRVSDPPPLPLERLALTPSHGFILSRIDGTTTVRDVVAILPPAEEEKASRFLFGLLVMGVLCHDPPTSDGPFRVANLLREHADRRALERMQERTIKSAYARMRTQNPHELLGVSSKASREAVERAYEEAKALFGKEQIVPKLRDRYRSELSVIESRLIEAYLKLTQPDSRDVVARREETKVSHAGARSADDLLVRVEMDKTRSKLAQEESQRIADGYFQQARQAMREGDYHNAIQYGKLAISYNDEDASYFYMLAECQARNPGGRWQHMAEQNYAKATQLDPWNADYLINLGRFYQKRGLTLRARRQFEEALKLSPGNEEALSSLKRLR